MSRREQQLQSWLAETNPSDPRQRREFTEAELIDIAEGGLSFFTDEGSDKKAYWNYRENAVDTAYDNGASNASECGHVFDWLVRTRLGIDTRKF